MKQHVLTLNAGKEEEGLVELTDTGDSRPNSALSSLVEAVNMNMTQMMAIANQQNQAVLNQHAQMAQQLTRPKQVVRDANGNIMGVQYWQFHLILLCVMREPTQSPLLLATAQNLEFILLARLN
jgi:hypothetical protein